MLDKEWLVLDTETTGFAAPITVVELAAQRMRGWESTGAPFRRLLNQNADISPEASRVNGYTREILERDGEPAIEVYRDFAAYARDLPIVSYNLEYDLAGVLKPEWVRLGIKPIGTTGFCALRLTQRLLDPVPAGNCKLQTLRQFYRLPERAAHTALGDVETVIDLFREVLRPIAERRGLRSWSDVSAYAEDEWFPSRIAFGKFKGRDFRDARDDHELSDWLSWLSNSSNERSARIGSWYLSQLAVVKEDNFQQRTEQIFEHANSQMEFKTPRPEAEIRIAIYRNPEIERLQALIAAARSRLADLEVAYTKDKRAVDHLRATIFGLVKEHYLERDRIKLKVEHRRKYLRILLMEGEEQAERVAEEYEGARAETESNYERASADAAANQRVLSEEDQSALNSLWRKLVRLFHPDRFAGQPDKQATYEKLTAAINRARDEGNMELLREIVDDPHGFILRQGWSALDLSDEAELTALIKLYTALQLQIVDLLELRNTLHESADFELLTLSQKKSQLIEEVAEEQKTALSAETAALKEEAARLQEEIDELAGAGHGSIG